LEVVLLLHFLSVRSARLKTDNTNLLQTTTEVK